MYRSYKSTQHIGYSGYKWYEDLFSKTTLQKISKSIQQNVYKKINCQVTAAECDIIKFLNYFLETETPEYGDIYRTNIPPRDHIKYILDRTVSHLTSEVIAVVLSEENASNLSVWDTVLGTFNRYGLMPHSTLKVREDPLPTNITMRY